MRCSRSSDNQPHHRVMSITSLLIVIATAASLPSCLFRLPETPTVDIPQLGADDLVAVDGYVDLTQETVDAQESPDMIWLPEEITNADAQWADSTDLTPDDSLTDPDTIMEFANNCPYPLNAFTPEVATNSFVVYQQSIITPVDPETPPEETPPADKIYVYYLSCGLERNSYGPERGYAVRVDSPGVITATARCSHKCYIFVHKDGCNYNNLTGCWSQGDTRAEASFDVLPGLYLISVEFEESDLMTDLGVADFEKAQFDLHVAHSNHKGTTPCESDSKTDLPSNFSCDESGEFSWSTTVDATLDWTAVDNFDLGCGYGDVAADPTGGMPDHVHAISVPHDLPSPVRISATLQMNPGPPPGAPSLPHLLAITSAPCGSAASVIDCLWGSESTDVSGEILAMPGDQLFAVVDGMGIAAFDFTSPQNYSLTWNVSGQCP